MMFIKLTRFDGTPIVVSTKRVQYMVAYSGFTSIVFDGMANSVDVKEDMEDILRQIMEAM